MNDFKRNFRKWQDEQQLKTFMADTHSKAALFLSWAMVGIVVFVAIAVWG